MAVEPKAFRQALSRFASGVTVVTMKQDDAVFGLTVSAFISVSLEPPLVLVSIDKKAKAYDTLMQTDSYGVSILGSEQADASSHFAGFGQPFEPEFEDLEGFPVLSSALAQLVCSIKERHDAGDHTLFIGQVEASAVRDGEPLIYAQGRYADIVPKGD